MVGRTSTVNLAASVGAFSFALLCSTTTRSTSAASDMPETVELAARTFAYRMAGDFQNAGRSVDAPVATIRYASLHVMKRQVTAAEYNRCVAFGACRPTTADQGASDRPVVKVSWHDAAAYAAWLSMQTGYSWRLPTDDEWAFFAGSRFHDDALSIVDEADPAARWLARYEKEAKREPFDQRPRPTGAFGANEYGIVDLSGNVWEWTNTCFTRQTVDAKGKPLRNATANCGVRVAEGQHRAYVTDFIRDASTGGCAAGTPPSNLGFRLVRENSVAAFIAEAERILVMLNQLFCQSAVCQFWRRMS
jgi:formylglycine-generating enzyme required for sulfatase activity